MATEQQTLIGRLILRAEGWSAGIKSAEKSMERFGTSMFFMGSRITASVTVPLVALASAVVKVGADFDQAMTESLAIIDKVTPQMRRQMEDTAKRVATTTKFSAQEAAEAYFFLASSGMSAAESMRALPVVANFAQAGVINLAKATELLSDAYITLGLRTGTASQRMQNMQRVADVLTEANNMAQGSIEEFAEALTNRAGVAMRVFGISVEEGVAALAAFAERGIKGKKAGQQLFIVIRDLQRAALKNREEWERLVGKGAVFDEVTGELNNLADIVGALEIALEGLSDRQVKSTLDMLGFQERSLQATLTLIGASERMREFEEAFSRAGGVVDRVAKKQMVSFSNQMHIVRERISQVAIALFDTFRPAFEQIFLPAIRDAIDKLEEFGEWLGKTSVGTRGFILSLGGFAALMGPVLAFFGGLVLFIRPLVPAFRGLIKPVTAFVGVIADWVIALKNFKLGAAGIAKGLLRLAGTVGVALTVISLLKKAVDLLIPSTLNLRNQLHRNVTALDMTASELKEQVDTYRAVSTAVGATEEELRKLENAETVLASTVGLTSESFRINAAASTELIDLYQDQITRLKELETAQMNEARAAIAIAFQKVVAIRGMIAEAQEGTLALEEQQSTFQRLMEGWGVWGRFLVSQVELISSAIAALEALWDGLVESIKNGIKWLMGWGEEIEINTVKMDRYSKILEFMIALTESAIAWMDKLSGRGAEQQEEEDLKALAAQVELTKKLQRAQDELAEAKVKHAELWEKFRGVLENTNTVMENGRSTADGFADNLDAIGGAADGGLEKTKAFRDKVADLLKLLRGLGNDTLPILIAAFGSLSAAELKNAGVIERLWDAYKPLRKNLDPSEFPAEIEALTKALREQDEWTKFLTTDAGKFVAAMTQVERKYIDIIDHSEDVAKAWKEMGGALPDRFFEEHGDTLRTLMIDYSHLVDGPIRDVIDAYVEWGTSSEQTSQKLKKIWADDSKWIREKSEDMVATLASKQSELAIFSLATGDQELIGLKKGYEERKLAHKRMIDEMTAKVFFLGEEEREAAQERLDIAKENGAEIILTDERIGLLRLAKARGFNARQLEMMAEMTADEIEILIGGKTDQIKLMRQFRDRMLVAGNLGALFEQMGGRFAALGAFIRSVAGDVTAFGNAADGFEDLATKAQKAAAAIQMATSVMSAFQKVADIKGKGKRAAAGAATGAQMGSAFGPWGALVGGIGGFLFGALKDDPNWAKIQDSIGDRFDASVSEPLARAIDKTTERTGSNLTAMFVHLNDIIAESGGVTAANVDHWTGILQQVFIQTRIGALDLAESAVILDQNFGALVEAGTLTSGVLKANVVELMLLNDEFGTGSEAIREYKEAMMDLAMEGLATFAAGNTSIREGLLARFETQKEQAKEAHDLEMQQLLDRAKELKLSGEEIQKIQDDGALRWEHTLGKMQLAFREDFIDKTFDDWKDLNTFTEMSFLAMTAGGMSFLDALDALEPSLAELVEMINITGENGGDAIEQLLRIRDFKAENEGLILQIQGMNDLMVGLANAGHMSQESFTTFGEAAGRQFEKLIDAGLDSNEALMLMAPSLQVIKDLADQYGFAIDANTKLLLDQATEQGILGERARTTDEIMSEGLLAVAEGIGTLIELFGGELPDSIKHLSEVAHGETGNITGDISDMQIDSNRHMDVMASNAEARLNDIAADAERITREATRDFQNLKNNANQELRGIHVPDINITSDIGVNVHWNYDEFKMPGGDHVQLMQHGGIISRPTLMVGGEGGEPEMIGPVGFMSEALRGALGNSGQGQNEVVSELQSLREDMELLPIHIRDAIITSQ